MACNQDVQSGIIVYKFACKSFTIYTLRNLLFSPMLASLNTCKELI